MFMRNHISHTSESLVCHSFSTGVVDIPFAAVGLWGIFQSLLLFHLFPFRLYHRSTEDTMWQLELFLSYWLLDFIFCSSLPKRPEQKNFHKEIFFRFSCYSEQFQLHKIPFMIASTEDDRMCKFSRNTTYGGDIAEYMENDINFKTNLCVVVIGLST